MGLQAGAGFFRPLDSPDPRAGRRVLISVGSAVVLHVLIMGAAILYQPPDQVLPEVQLRLVDGASIEPQVTPMQTETPPPQPPEEAPVRTTERNAQSAVVSGSQARERSEGGPESPQPAPEPTGRQAQNQGFLDNLFAQSAAEAAADATTDAPSREELRAAAEAGVVGDSSSEPTDAEAANAPDAATNLANRIDQAAPSASPGSSAEESSPGTAAESSPGVSAGTADFSGRRLTDPDTFAGLRSLQLRDPGLTGQTIAIHFRIEPSGYAELLPGVLPTGISTLDQALDSLFGRVLFTPSDASGAVNGVLTLSVDG